MSSQDTMNTAQNELTKAEEFEKQAQEVMAAAQQQADNFRQKSQSHRNEHTRLLTKAQDEQRRENEADIQAVRDEQKKNAA